MSGLVKGHGGWRPSVRPKPVSREQHFRQTKTPISPLPVLRIGELGLVVNPASTATALLLVLGELKRTEMRQLPVDSLRRVALVVEEAGEALQEVLNLTRSSCRPEFANAIRQHLRDELTQTASMAVTVLAAMVREDDDAAVYKRHGTPVMAEVGKPIVFSKTNRSKKR